MQTEREKYQSVVCFSPEKHEKIRNLASSKTPVKVTQVTMVPGRVDPTVSDIQVSRRSNIQSASVDFAFKAKETQVTPLEDVLNSESYSTVSTSRNKIYIYDRPKIGSDPNFFLFLIQKFILKRGRHEGSPVRTDTIATRGRFSEKKFRLKFVSHQF